jgi:RNA polymerase sigma-70 factor, ECF subfamily
MSDDRFQELYRRYGRLIHRHCRRMLGQDQSAKDATQEIFCRIAKHLESAPNSEQALFWICRISNNYCRNQIRNEKRRPTPSASVEHIDEVSTEDALLQRDLARRLMLRVPVHLRASAWLYHVYGMSHEEVGRTLGISRRTVINHIADFERRALKFIRTSPKHQRTKTDFLLHSPSDAGVFSI